MTDDLEKALSDARVDLYNRHLQIKDPPPRDPWVTLAEIIDKFESLLKADAEKTREALEALKRKHSG